MENNKSWLKLDKIPIIPGLSIRIPSVGEVLENEKAYYSVSSSLTAIPFTYMVQLDDMGIDYTTINDWDLFRMMFCSYSNQIVVYEQKIYELKNKMAAMPENSQDYVECALMIRYLQNQIDEIGINLVFDDLKMSGVFNGRIIGFTSIKNENGEDILYNPATDVSINSLVHMDIANAIRKVNLYKKLKHKPGNEHARKYLLKKERRKQKRNAKKPYEPYLENMVVALVNTNEFPYDYDSCMDLSIYRLNQSFRQIQHKIAFDKTMIGVYAGTVDVSKMTDKDRLSWIQTTL